MALSERAILGTVPAKSPDDRLQEVRRPQDSELCGFVRRHHEGFQALTIFHGVLGQFEDAAEASQHVADRGLASLRDHWHFRASPEDEWQIVLVQEARPGWVRLVLGYYSLAGVPTLEVAFDDASEAELVLLP